METFHTKWMLLINCMIFICLILAGCVSSEDTEPLETTEEQDIAKVEVEASIAGWIPMNVDNVSDSIGKQVTADTLIARDIVSKAVKTALLTELELSVYHTKPLEGEDKYSARVALGFPLLLELPVVGKKEYWITIGYDFTIEGGEVVDAKIDASSFKMDEQNN